MALISFVFVWAIIKMITFMNVSNKRVTVSNVVQTEALFMRDNHNENHQNDKSYNTKKLKDQILTLYESDYNKSGQNVDKIIELLSMFRQHHDTSELLDSNPYILDYIFRNSA